MNSLLAAGVELGLHGVSELCKSQKDNESLQTLGKVLDYGATMAGIVLGDPVAIGRAGLEIAKEVADKGLVGAI
ncbi:MAG TPA: hypothetical protein VHA13_04290, partial [Gammaproteobacteria bacterium]|nr:hypothetical protein [Gammaproteobacteria bacterium]